VQVQTLTLGVGFQFAGASQCSIVDKEQYRLSLLQEFNKASLNIIQELELPQLKLNNVKSTIISLPIFLGFGLLFLASSVSCHGDKI
jgi:hypothetical protein